MKASGFGLSGLSTRVKGRGHDETSEFNTSGALQLTVCGPQYH